MTTGRINQVTIMCRGTANRRLAATAELVPVGPAAWPPRAARTGDGWALGAGAPRTVTAFQFSPPSSPGRQSTAHASEAARAAVGEAWGAPGGDARPVAAWEGNYRARISRSSVLVQAR